MTDRPNQGRGGKQSLAAMLTAAALAAPKLGARDAPPVPEDFKFGQQYKPRRGERPTTMPRDQQGQHINPSRRQKKAFKAVYKLEHGRRMNGKAMRRHVRARKALIPALLEVEAMVSGRRQ